MKIKIVTEKNKSPADVDVGQRRNEGGIVGDDEKNGRMQSTTSLKLKPPSSGSPTCQNEYDSMDLTSPCQALAFDKLYKSHLHALIDDEEESNSSKSDRVQRPVHILPDDEESISSISNNQNENIQEDYHRIEAEEIEFSELLNKVFSFTPSSASSSPAAAFCRLECGGLPDVIQDVDTDLSNDLHDLIMGEEGVETTSGRGALNLLNDWVQLNDHAERIGDEEGEGGVQHDEEGDKEGGRKGLGVEEGQTEKDDPRILSEDEVPIRVLTITTPLSSGNNNGQSLPTKVVSATKCSCTIM